MNCKFHNLTRANTLGKMVKLSDFRGKLDPKGTIIATNIRGEELNKKLAEIFKM